MRMNNINMKEGRLKQIVKWLTCAACLTFSPSHFLTSPASAQLVTEIKVFAVQEFDKLESAGYTGAEKDLDFRKGRGGGYVFTLLGRAPKVGDKVEDEYCIYEVISAGRMRVKRVKVTVKKQKEEA